MTVPGLIIISMLSGASVAFGARVQIANLQRPMFYNRYFAALLMLQAMIFVPVGVYFGGFYPDWSWMYLVDTRTISVGLGTMAVLAYPVCAILGYLVGYFSARSSSDWVTVMFMVFLALGLVGLIIVGRDQICYLGTYSQFNNNVNLKSISKTSLLPSIIVAIIGLMVSWGYVVFRFWREGHVSMGPIRK